jgi:hypothetical protein
MDRRTTIDRNQACLTDWCPAEGVGFEYWQFSAGFLTFPKSTHVRTHEQRISLADRRARDRQRCGREQHIIYTHPTPRPASAAKHRKAEYAVAFTWMSAFIKPRVSLMTQARSKEDMGSFDTRTSAFSSLRTILDRTPVRGTYQNGQIRVYGFEELLCFMRSLKQGEMWRRNVAGDLPSNKRHDRSFSSSLHCRCHGCKQY